MKIDILRQTYITSEFSHETTIESGEFAIEPKLFSFSLYHKLGIVASVTGAVIVVVILAAVLNNHTSALISKYDLKF